MILKFLTLVILVASAWWCLPQPASRPGSNPLADAIDLVPLRIGSFQRQSQIWKIDRSDGAIEEGAMYAKVSEPEHAIQLDFYRAYNKAHNGLLCYLGQGETLLWTQSMVLNHKHHAIQLLLGMTQSDHRLRLTAATECFAEHCHEEFLPTQWSVHTTPGWFWSDSGVELKPTAGLVPMSIVLQQSFSEGQQAHIQHAMMQRLQAFLDAFDFAPVMALAQHQN
jgi:hypothetical protein